MTDPPESTADLAEKAAAAVVAAHGLPHEDGESALAALGWAQGTAITHEDAFRAFARALVDELGMPGLLEAKLELLGEYKLDCPQDYEPDDVARIQTELARLRSLQQMLAGRAG